MNSHAGSIYLAGSFYNFRDRIISSLPNLRFHDPRNNRQHAMFATVTDDLEAAVACPSFMGVFPAMKEPGIMTMVELGAAYASGSDIITIDENAIGGVIKDAARSYFTSIEWMIESMNSYKVPEKHVASQTENLGKVDQVYICGRLTAELQYFAEAASRDSPDRRFILRGDSLFEDVGIIEGSDLVMVHFPKGQPRDRESCFALGIAAYRKIPVLLVDEGSFIYPPLAAVARRQAADLWAAMKYVTLIESNDIAAESQLMYQMFKQDGMA